LRTKCNFSNVMAVRFLSCSLNLILENLEFAFANSEIAFSHTAKTS